MSTNNSAEKLIKDIKTLSFEVRFDSQFQIWDNAGKIWSDIQEIFNVEGDPSHVEPNTMKFTFGKEYQVGLEIKKFHTLWNGKNSDFDSFFTKSASALAVLNQYAKIDNYKRVGFRQIEFEDVPGIKQAATRLIKNGIVKDVQGSPFNIKGKLTNPEISSRWEDDDIGIHVKVATNEIKFGVDAPLEWEKFFNIPTEQAFAKIVYDVDYYTKKQVKASQLDAKVWCEQAKKIIDRDLEAFLKR